MNYSKIQFGTGKTYVSDDKRTTVVEVTMYVDGKEFKTIKGKAVLNTTDTYDERVGKSLAESRAKRKLMIAYRNKFRGFKKQVEQQLHELQNNEAKIDKILTAVTSDIKYYSK